MRGTWRGLVLAALASCAPQAAPPPPAPPVWEYAAPVHAWGLGADRGALGRGQAPQPMAGLGIAGPAGAAPLAGATLWQVPGDGAARAVVEAAASVELVDIDAGRVLWRGACDGPIAAVTRDVIVCLPARGVAAIALADGAPRWTRDATLVVAADDRLLLARDGGVLVLDAARGEVRADIALPSGVLASDVRAACGAEGRELFAATAEGKLVRLLAGATGPAKVAWAAPIGPLTALDACTGDSVRATGLDGASAAIVALDRRTGKVTGRVTGVRGAWPARAGAPDAIEIASASGVARWPADLAGDPELLPLPALGAPLAARGGVRLVRASAATAVLLDASGVRARVSLGAGTAALGDDALLVASAGVRRFALPARFAQRLRVPRATGLAVPAELRDLPALAPLAPDAIGAGAPSPALGVAAVAIDPDDASAIYAVAVGDTAGDAAPAPGALARGDLRSRAWRWTRADGCGGGPRVELAIGHDVIACAARGVLRVTGKDGAPRWERAGVDGVAAAGDVVLAFAGDRALALAARDGHLLGALASDDGDRVRAAVLELEGTTWLVAAERGRLVARVPLAAMLPAWSRAVAGTITAVATAGDGVLVELDDGDAYRVGARTGDVVPLAGLGLAWRAFPDLLAGATAGGPIPPADLAWLPAPPRAVPAPNPPAPPHVEIESPPPIVEHPWPAPPPMRASWQATLYDVTGGVRARNDYALPEPIAPLAAAARGPAGSPLLVAVGPGGRELLVLDPERGDPLRRVALPAAVPDALPFASVVDGAPRAGAVLAAPLRLALF